MSNEVDYEAKVKEVYPDAKARRTYGYDCNGKRNKKFVFAIYKHGTFIGNIISEWSLDSKAAWQSAYNKIKAKK